MIKETFVYKKKNHVFCVLKTKIAMFKRIILYSLVVWVWMACQRVDEQQSSESLLNAEKKENTEASSASNDSEKGNSAIAKIEFEKEVHDFGTIKEGEKVSYKFKFKNTGTVPLLVKNVKPACGCTTYGWTKEEVPPGGEGFVEVVFNSEGRTGVQNKSVEVFANTDPEVTTLKFKGEVKK